MPVVADMKFSLYISGLRDSRATDAVPGPHETPPSSQRGQAAGFRETDQKRRSILPG